MADNLRALERENRELRKAKEVLCKASAYFAMAPSANEDIRLSGEVTAGRMGASRSARSCRPLLDLPRPCGQAAGSRPSCRRARQNIALKIELRCVFEQNFSVYGVRKVWRQLKREGSDVTRCTVVATDAGDARCHQRQTVRTTVRDKAAHARWITSIASSRRQGRTFTGFPTSPMPRSGPALSMSPSSSIRIQRRIIRSLRFIIAVALGLEAAQRLTLDGVAGLLTLWRNPLKACLAILRAASTC